MEWFTHLREMDRPNVGETRAELDRIWANVGEIRAELDRIWAKLHPAPPVPSTLPPSFAGWVGAPSPTETTSAPQQETPSSDGTPE